MPTPKPKCSECGRELSCAHCPAAEGGKVGGRSTSRAKRRAVRANGKLGGRPKLPPHNLSAHKAIKDTSLRKLAPGCGRCRRRAEKLKHIKEMLTPAPQIDAAETVAAIHRARRRA